MPITTISGELYLDGDVGDCGLPEFFTAKEVSQALATIGSKKRAKLRINSGGGLAWEGVAIAAAIKAHAGGVDVVVEGVAASAATPAVCAATTATIAFGSIFMVHEASSLTVGTMDDHQASIAMLDTMNASMAGIYAAKTRQSVPAMRELMKAETWMTCDDAVARGFCDAVVWAPGAHPAFARFDYTKYRHPPAALKLQALAGRRAASEDRAQREAWATIADICLKAGRTDMTADLIQANVSVEEARRRIEKAQAQAEGRRLGQESMLKIIERKHGKAARAQAEAKFASRPI